MTISVFQSPRYNPKSADLLDCPHTRIAERAYFLALAGIGADDLDRWLTAEAREMPAGIEAAPARQPAKRRMRRV